MPNETRQAGADDVEVTEAMIEAGVRELCLWSQKDDDRMIVECVFRAMSLKSE